jgi:hypothetical protein
MWRCERTEKSSWNDRVGNEEALHGVKERNNIGTVKRRKANWIGYSWRGNLLLEHINEGNLQGRTCDGKTTEKT